MTGARGNAWRIAEGVPCGRVHEPVGQLVPGISGKIDGVEKQWKVPCSQPMAGFWLPLSSL
jgi:hypothetical protein